MQPKNTQPFQCSFAWFISLSLNLSLSLFIYRSIYLSIYLSVYLSIDLSISLSIDLYFLKHVEFGGLQVDPKP